MLALSFPPTCGEGGHIVSGANDVTGGGLFHRRFAPPQKRASLVSTPQVRGMKTRAASPLTLAKPERVGVVRTKEAAEYGSQ